MAPRVKKRADFDSDEAYEAYCSERRERARALNTLCARHYRARKRAAETGDAAAAASAQQSAGQSPPKAMGQTQPPLAVPCTGPLPPRRPMYKVLAVHHGPPESSSAPPAQLPQEQEPPQIDRAARNRTWTPFRNRCGALLLRSAAPVVTPHPGIAEQLRAAHRPRLSGAVGGFALACWRRSK